MNVKANLFNIGLASLVTVGLASAYTLDPTQEQQVLIYSPSYIVDDLDLGRYNDCTTDCKATLLTEDEQYQIEVTFDYSGFPNGNGYQAWNDAEIDQLKSLEIYKYDDESKVEDQLDQYEIAKIKDAIVAEILDKRA